MITTNKFINILNNLSDFVVIILYTRRLDLNVLSRYLFCFFAFDIISIFYYNFVKILYEKRRIFIYDLAAKTTGSSGLV